MSRKLLDMSMIRGLHLFYGRSKGFSTAKMLRQGTFGYPLAKGTLRIRLVTQNQEFSSFCDIIMDLSSMLYS